MSKCRNCKIEILDRTGVCPLCHCVVEQDGAEREAAYPDVGIREKRFALIIRIYVFLACYGRGTVGIHQCKLS